MSMSHEEMIAVIQADKEGKTVEFRQRARSQWLDCMEPIWDFSDFDYRIKPTPPKPREWWICYDSISDYGDPVNPLFWSVRQVTGRKQIHVREVLPEE